MTQLTGWRDWSLCSPRLSIPAPRRWRTYATLHLLLRLALGRLVANDYSMSATWSRASRIVLHLARWLLPVLVGFWALYLVLVHALLWTGGLGALLHWADDGLYLRVRAAYSLWPGRVHAERVHLVFEDGSVQFSVEVRNARVDVVLPALLARRFEIDGLLGSDVEFLLRLKVHPNALESARLEAFAPIPRVGPPVKPIPPPPPPDPDQLWEVRLKQVGASIRRIWIDEVRLDGELHVNGGFGLQPIRQVLLDATQLELKRATIHVDDAPVVSALEGRLVVRIEPTSLEDPGFDDLSTVSGTVDLDAEPGDLEFLGLYLPDEVRVQAAGERWLRLHGSLERGTLAPDGALDVGLRVLHFNSPDFAGDGAMHLQLTSRGGAHVAGPLRLEAKQLAVQDGELRFLGGGTLQLYLDIEDLWAPRGAARALQLALDQHIDSADGERVPLAIEVASPVLRWRDAHLAGRLAVVARGAEGVLEYFAAAEVVPGLIPALHDADVATLQLDVCLSDPSMRLDILEARVGEWHTRGRLLQVDDQLQYALLVHASVVPVGLMSSDGESNVSPFIGEDWLETRLKRIARAAGGSGERAVCITGAPLD